MIPALPPVRTSTATMLYRALLLLIGLILFLDGMVLVLSGKIHLGIAIPLMVGLVFSSYAIFYAWFKRQLLQKPKLRKYWYAVWALFGTWLFSFAFFAYTLHHNMQQQPTASNIQAIIVLGSGTKQGQPSPALAQRLDSAVTFFRLHPQAIFILSGGVDFGEHESEAVIMSRYLQAKYHIPPAKLILEERSTSTQLNLQNSKVLLLQYGIMPEQPIAIVTSDFHTIRSAAIAKKQGYKNAIMVGSPTPLSIRYNAWLREYFAFISGWILNEY